MLNDSFYDRVRRVTDAKDIVIGIRPEYVRVSPESSGVASLRAQVFTRQLLGNQILYDLIVKDSHLRVVTPAKQMFDLDEHVCVDFSWDSAFAFDKQTEACIVN